MQLVLKSFYELARLRPLSENAVQQIQLDLYFLHGNLATHLEANRDEWTVITALFNEAIVSAGSKCKAELSDCLLDEETIKTVCAIRRERM